MSEVTLDDRGAQRWLVASAAIAVFMGRLDIYVVNISLPTIAKHFDIGTTAASWVTISYLLFSCGAMLLMGHVADAVSPRRLFICGYAVFTAASLLCGFSQGFGMLIFLRCVQGLGASILVTMTFTVVSRFLPRRRVGGATGILATFGALGIAVGSPLGAFLAARFSWRWVFFVNVPIGVLAILLAHRAIPGDTRAKGRLGKLDYVGAVLSLLAIACFILALNFGQNERWSSPSTLVLFALFAILGSLFLARQLTTKDPLVAPSLLKDKPFLLANAVSVSGLIVMGGNAFLMPFFLERVKGLPTERAGLLLLVYSLTFIVLSPLSGRLADRVAPWRLCAIGMGLGTVVCLLFALAMGDPGLSSVVLFLAALALAYAVFMASNAKEVLESASAEHKGIASAVFGTLYTLGLLLGVGIFETLCSGAHASAGPPLADTAAHWQPGFSNAYLFGAGACLISCVLACSIPFLDRNRRSSTTKRAGRL